MLTIFTKVLAYGIKGVGELATIPTAPALAGAYFALDGQLRPSLPLENTPYQKKKRIKGDNSCHSLVSLF